MSSNGDIAPLEAWAPGAVIDSVATGANLIHIAISAKISAVVTETAMALRILTSCGGCSRPRGPGFFSSSPQASVTASLAAKYGQDNICSHLAASLPLRHAQTWPLTMDFAFRSAAPTLKTDSGLTDGASSTLYRFGGLGVMRATNLQIAHCGSAA